MAPVRTGIIGYGNSARVFHLPYILQIPDLEVVAFLQRSEPTPGKRHCSIDYPDAKWHKSIEDFCADPNIDLGIVITGQDSHFELAEACLKAGKHVCVEKPFTTTSADADKLLALAKKQGKVLAPFQNRRYDSDFRTLESIVEAGHLGEIHEAAIHYDLDAASWAIRDSGPGWKPGQGLNFGIGCHALDQALALFGQPAYITAFYRVLRPYESKTEDTYTMILEYEGSKAAEQRLVTVKTNVYSRAVPMKYYFRGREGTFLKFGEDPQETQTSEGLTPKDAEFGYEDESLYGELTTLDKRLEGQVQLKGKWNHWVGKVKSLKGDYALFYADLAAACKGERPLKVKPETSRDGIRIIELARESAEAGKKVKFD